MAGNRAVDERLKAGIDAARRGDRSNAQKLLRQVVTSNPNNEVAWMWLASVADTMQERRSCLERAVRINPNNARAQEALRQLGVAAPERSGVRPMGEGRRTNPAYVIVGGLLVLAVLAAVVLNSLLAPPPPVTEATIAVFNELVTTDTATPPPDPRSFTATPFFGVLVKEPTFVWTLPPTFTPTFTPTSTQPPPPTATLLPMSAFTLLYTAQTDTDAQPALFRSGGDTAEVRQLGSSAEGFSDVAYAPNGVTMAFVRVVTYTNAESTEVTAPELFLAPVDQPEAARQLTQLGGTKLESPGWSPDSTRLVFVSDQAGEDDLWVVGVDGSAPRQLTTNTGVDKDPAWSPRGDVIIYASDEGGLPGSGVTQLFSITPDGLTNTQLTVSGNSSYQPAWSPDGSRVAFASDRNGDGDIFVMDPDGQRPELLTLDGQTGEDRRPVFSPDGRWVVFLSNREGETFQLYRVSLDARTQERLSDIDQNLQSFTFRPLTVDGR